MAGYFIFLGEFNPVLHRIEQVFAIFLVSCTDLLANNFLARRNAGCRERKGIHWTALCLC